MFLAVVMIFLLIFTCWYMHCIMNSNVLRFRYDHYSVLCELLPVGLPSLSLCLLILSSGLTIMSLSQPVVTTVECCLLMSFSQQLQLCIWTLFAVILPWHKTLGTAVLPITWFLISLDRCFSLLSFSKHICNWFAHFRCLFIIIIIIRNLYSAITPLGGYRGAGGTGR